MKTFKDVEKRYMQAVDYMAFNEESALNENSNPSHVAWIHHLTLARWLYGSSQEFVRDYTELSGKLMNKTPEQKKQISIWHIDLTQRLEQFQTKLRNKFPNYISLIEALK